VHIHMTSKHMWLREVLDLIDTSPSNGQRERLMNRFQVTAFLGICILCSAAVPFYLPRTAYVGLPVSNPTELSTVLGLAGIIVLLISVIFRYKPVPAC
jgi:hypothetical protein